MKIKMDPVEGAVVSPPLEDGTDNTGTEFADIAQRMHQNGMTPDEILQKVDAGPLVTPPDEVDLLADSLPPE